MINESHKIILIAALSMAISCKKSPISGNSSSASTNLKANSVSDAKPKFSPHPAPNMDVGDSQNLRISKVGQDLEKLFGNDLKTYTTKEWKILKSNYWTHSWNDSIGLYSSGKSTADILKSHDEDQPLIVKIASQDFGDIPVSEQDNLLAWWLFVMGGVHSSAASIPSAFQDRFKDDHITKGDAIMYAVFTDACVELPISGHLAEEQNLEWENMASSRNPVYRLLAAKLYLRVESEPMAWSSFYRSYRNESDRSILDVVIDMLFATEHPNAIAVLKEFKNSVGISGDPVIIQKLDTDINFMEKNLTRLHHE